MWNSLWLWCLEAFLECEKKRAITTMNSTSRCSSRCPSRCAIHYVHCARTFPKGLNFEYHYMQNYSEVIIPRSFRLGNPRSRVSGKRGWQKRLAKGWRKVGEGLAKGWHRVGEGLAGFLAPSNFAIPEAPV